LSDCGENLFKDAAAGPINVSMMDKTVGIDRLKTIDGADEKTAPVRS
jgi:hypothetical protein